jgi:hypothetical protein
VEYKAVNAEWQIGEIEGKTLKTHVTTKKGNFKKVLERQSWRTQVREDIDGSGERLDTDTVG